MHAYTSSYRKPFHPPILLSFQPAILPTFHACFHPSTLPFFYPSILASTLEFAMKKHKLFTSVHQSRACARHVHSMNCHCSSFMQCTLWITQFNFIAIIIIFIFHTLTGWVQIENQLVDEVVRDNGKFEPCKDQQPVYGSHLYSRGSTRNIPGDVIDER